MVNGTLETFFDPSQLPAGPSQLRPVHPPERRDRADRRQRQLLGHRRRRRGQHRPGHEHRRPARPPADLQRRGQTACSRRCPATTAASTWPGARAMDQSGNQSNSNDPNAQLPFIVDDTAPTAQFVSPTSGQVITSLTNGAVQFTITTSENIDLTHFTAASIQVDQRRPRRHPRHRRRRRRSRSTRTRSRSPTSTRGPAARAASRSRSRRPGTLTNNLYSVTLLNTGADAVRDIAGNNLASPVTQDFAVGDPLAGHEPVRRRAGLRHRLRPPRWAPGRTPTRPSAPR